MFDLSGKSALITGSDYGTRVSTVMAFGADGRAIFEERTREADGSVVHAVTESFSIDTVTA